MSKDTKPKVSPGIKKGGGIPPGFEKRQLAFVYAKPSSKDKPPPAESSKIQGVWTEFFNAVNPVELWIFEKGEEPSSLFDSGHPIGIWGYKTGVNTSRSQIEDMLFLPPNAKPPKSFNPRGVWTFPVMKRDDSVLKEKEAGFIHVGDATKKEDLDVAGTWRMLYHRPGEDKPPPPPKDMKIHVRKTNGEKLTLTVKPENTINDVKDMVNDRTGIPKDEQRLTYKNNPLDDKPTLKEYGIEDGDILVLEPMEIYVKDTNGKKYTLLVEPTDIIDHIKLKLERQEGIPKNRQRLTFAGKPCDDNKNLRLHGIKHQSVLNLMPMIIYVEDPTGKRYTLKNVNPENLIDHIKDKLQNQEGIPKKRQRLTFKGKLCTDSKTLDDHGIQHESVLHLAPMQVFVRTPDGKTLTFEVEPTDKIIDLKNRVEQKEKIPVDRQRMTFKNEPLKRGEATLDDEGIKHGDTIMLDPMVVYVRTIDGKTLTFEVKHSDKIGDIKKRVEEKENIPVDKQRMSFKNKPLTNDRATLNSEGIEHKDTIHLQPMVIYVKDWKGKTFSLEVDPKENIEDVKAMIEKREGHPADEQILKFCGTELKAPKNLSDYGIRHKDTIDLSKPMPVAPPTPPQPTYTVQLSPYKSPLEAAYSPTRKTKKEGIRAKTKELFQTRWHTDLASENEELGRIAAENHRKEKEAKT